MSDLADILHRTWPPALAVAGLLVAALASGMETGLYRVNRIRLRLRADAGGRRARRLLSLLGDLRGLIIVCLIGYNGGVYLATAVVTRLVDQAGWADDDLGVSIFTTAILTPVFFVFTDVTPKSIFTYEADRWMVRLVPVLGGAYRFLRMVLLVPALKGISTLALRVARRAGPSRLSPFLPRQRLRAFLREGAAEGIITGYQDELVEKVLGLRDRTVREAMIPISRAWSVRADIGREAFIEQLRQHSCTRLPVWEKRPENVVGVVHILAVLAADPDGPFDLRRLMTRDPVAVAADTPVSQALFRMQRERAAMAIVRDARQRAVGILTIKDLVEEIVGDLTVW